MSTFISRNQQGSRTRRYRAGAQAKLLTLQSSAIPTLLGDHLKAALEVKKLNPCMYVGEGMATLTYIDDVLFFG